MRPVARALAERGYQVVVRSARGTLGSQGVFDPFRHEADDVADTLAWLADQPWFGGSVAMTGASHLGFVQWAVAANAPPSLRALALQVTASEFQSLIHPDGPFALDSVLSRAHTVHHQEGRPLRVLASMIDRTGSGVAIACGCRCRAGRIPGSPATPAAASRWAPAGAGGPPTRRSSTTPTIPRRWWCRGCPTERRGVTRRRHPATVRWARADGGGPPP
jgi:predicted acyl esterase